MSVSFFNFLPFSRSSIQFTNTNKKEIDIYRTSVFYSAFFKNHNFRVSEEEEEEEEEEAAQTDEEEHEGKEEGKVEKEEKDEKEGQEEKPKFALKKIAK